MKLWGKSIPNRESAAALEESATSAIGNILRNGEIARRHRPNWQLSPELFGSRSKIIAPSAKRRSKSRYLLGSFYSQTELNRLAPWQFKRNDSCQQNHPCGSPKAAFESGALEDESRQQGPEKSASRICHVVEPDVERNAVLIRISEHQVRMTAELIANTIAKRASPIISEVLGLRPARSAPINPRGTASRINAQCCAAGPSTFSLPTDRRMSGTNA